MLMQTEHEKPLPAELPYERSVPWYARRRNFYLIVFLLFLNVVATTSISWGPLVMRDVQARLDARRAAKAQAATAAKQAAAGAAEAARRAAAAPLLLNYAIPQGHVVYTDDMAEAAKLLAGTGYSLVAPNNSTSAKLPQLPALADRSPGLGTAIYELRPLQEHALVFLHARTTPTTKVTRLIRVSVQPECQVAQSGAGDGDIYAVAYRRNVRFELFDPPTSSAPASRVWALNLNISQPEKKQPQVFVPRNATPPKLVQPGDALRLLSGRLDSSDGSRWYVDYTLEGKPGTITASLRDDDRIRLDLPGANAATLKFDGNDGIITWYPHPAP